MKKSLLIVLLALFVCVSSILVGSSQQPKTRVETKEERAQKREERKWHTRSVYRGLLDPTRDKIPDLVAKENRDIGLVTYVGLPYLDPFAPPFSLQRVLNSRACDVDAIVIGVVKSQTSRLTEDETYIYTINELHVTTVLRDNLAQSIKPGEHLNVLRTGGVIELNGRKVTALYKAALWLEIGKSYLLFLSFVPEKGVYVADSISYKLENNKIVVLTEGPIKPELDTGNDANSFISSVRRAIALPCDD